jgi:thiol:disulfide interchange protein DsbD
MAVPHVFLAAVPGLTRRLPKPGVWMEYFKQTMGFLLVPAVLYLLATLPTAGGWPFRVAGFATALTFGLWVWGSWVRYDASLLRKALIRGPAVLLVVLLGFWLLPRPPKPLVAFESFDAQRIADARQEGKVVVVKVTAAWCTECKILDYQVFNTPEIAEAFERRDVVAVKADVTEGDSAAARWVRRTAGGAPPLTIIYPTDGGDARVVPGRFSKAELIAMLDAAAGP